MRLYLGAVNRAVAAHAAKVAAHPSPPSVREQVFRHETQRQLEAVRGYAAVDGAEQRVMFESLFSRVKVSAHFLGLGPRPPALLAPRNTEKQPSRNAGGGEEGSREGYIEGEGGGRGYNGAGSTAGESRVLLEAAEWGGAARLAPPPLKGTGPDGASNLDDLGAQVRQP